MTRINKTILVGVASLGLTAFAQEAPQATTPSQDNPPAAAQREAMAARREAMQKLTADFSAAVKNGSLTAEDQKKAQAAIAKLQQAHVKGAPRDPQARHEAMRVVRQMSANPALRQEDRDLLAKDLAAITPNRAQR